MTDYRPRGTSGPMYNPQRDLAHIGPSIIQMAISGLDEANQSPEFKTWLQVIGVTNADLCRLITDFVEAQRLFVYAPQVKKINDAFDETGFSSASVTLRHLLYEEIGAVTVGAWFQAVREVTFIGGTTPAEQQVAEMLSTGREVARRGGYEAVKPVPTEVEMEVMRHEHQAMTVRVAQLEKIIERQGEQLHKLQTTAPAP